LDHQPAITDTKETEQQVSENVGRPQDQLREFLQSMQVMIQEYCAVMNP
jgi:hypothetical protein